MGPLFCQPFVAKVMLEIGIRLSLHHCDRKAISIFDWIFKRFGERGEQPFATISATALIRKGFLLESTNRYEDALKAYTEVITRFANQGVMIERVAAAKYNRASIFEVLSRPLQAQKDYLEIVLSFSESKDVRLRTLSEVSKRRLKRLGSIPKIEI